MPRRLVALLLLAACAPSSQEWTLTPDGVGPLTIGMDILVADSLLGNAFEVPSFISGCDLLPLGAPHAGVWLMFRDGTLVRAEVREPGVADLGGVQVGDAEAEALARHGDRVRQLPHKWVEGSYLVILPAAGADTLRRTVIETERGRVSLIRAGRMPEVEWTEGCV